MVSCEGVCFSRGFPGVRVRRGGAQRLELRGRQGRQGAYERKGRVRGHHSRRL